MLTQLKGKSVDVIESSTASVDNIYIRSLSFAFLYIAYFKHIFPYREISLFLIFLFRFHLLFFVGTICQHIPYGIEYLVCCIARMKTVSTWT